MISKILKIILFVSYFEEHVTVVNVLREKAIAFVLNSNDFFLSRIY